MLYIIFLMVGTVTSCPLSVVSNFNKSMSNVSFSVTNSKMEKHLERVLEDNLSVPKVEGCLFADQQGLCLGATGNANMKQAGLYVSLAKHAAKIEPQNPNPVISFDNGKRTLIIHSNGSVTCAITKSST